MFTMIDGYVQDKAPRCLTGKSQTEDGCRGAMYLGYQI